MQYTKEQLWDIIDAQQEEIKRLEAKCSEYLDNWVSAQDLAAWRNMRLCADLGPEVAK